MIQPPQDPRNQPPPGPVAPPPRNALAVASMYTSGIALVLLFCGYPGPAVGVIAIILGAVALHQARRRDPVARLQATIGITIASAVIVLFVVLQAAGPLRLG